MTNIRRTLEDDERGLAEWLRSRKENNTAFLLAIDQFEELFTYADVSERQSFDRLVATALQDPECPLYLLSTVRADFQDRFDRDLPELQVVRNELGKSWSLPLIGKQGLGEIISGPAHLAGLDVSEVQTVMLGEAKSEPGALPPAASCRHSADRRGHCMHYNRGQMSTPTRRGCFVRESQSSSEANSARRERSPLISVMWPECSQFLNLSTT